ncbi:hypothetical protein L873DRAFT_1684900 [Choiromyces venosus 120613-1]|uniref:Nephrocystin 3-like N-terminal domain-containing protein n=1 Tax=Choiromyces venosus 120613-1 TaxID=1336337 RepID=A0A3N4JSI3_9PEZI|nr:hypothetical protein L873DRAFT_1684900 [Choiromyces venosus 120613-1]
MVISSGAPITTSGYSDIRTRRVKYAGDWLLPSDEYRGWSDGSMDGKSGSAALFCSGGPVVGKTYISSLVIDSLCDQAEGENVAVACFYFDYAEGKEQTPTRVLGALLKQIVAGSEVIPPGSNN